MFIDDNDDSFKKYQRAFRKMEIEVSEKNIGTANFSMGYNQIHGFQGGGGFDQCPSECPPWSGYAGEGKGSAGNGALLGLVGASITLLDAKNSGEVTATFIGGNSVMVSEGTIFVGWMLKIWIYF